MAAAHQEEGIQESQVVVAGLQEGCPGSQGFPVRVDLLAVGRCS